MARSDASSTDDDTPPTPLVTVVIPCYNRSDELGRALTSVLGQSEPDFEVIVGDDASTEDLGAVVASFGDPRLRVVRREINGGISAGRNVAIAAARGTYLAFLDSDDEWLPEHLALAVARLASSPAPVAAVTTAFEMRFPSGRVDQRRPSDGVALLDRVVRGVDLSAGSTMLIRSEAMTAIGPWPEDVPRNEDYDWFLRMALAGYELAVLPNVTVVIHSDDRSPLDESALRRSHEIVLGRYGSELRRRGGGRLRHLRAKFHEEKAWAAWRSSRRTATIGHVLVAVAFDPAARSRKLSRSIARRARHLAPSIGRH